MATEEEILTWAERGDLIPRMVDIMSHTPPSEIKQFFIMIRDRMPKYASGIDWRRLRQDLAVASDNNAFRTNMVLFSLIVDDPRTDEYDAVYTTTAPTFPRTKRPLTAHVRVTVQEMFLLRVIRYMNSPSKGLWHKQTESYQGGTFYYYEPDSVTMISCSQSNVLFAANKIHAAYLLLHQIRNRSHLLAALRACHEKLTAFNEPHIAAIQSPAFKQFVLSLLDALARDDMMSVRQHPLLQLSWWGRPMHLLQDIDHTMRRANPSEDDTGLFWAKDRGLSPNYIGYTIWSKLDQLDTPLYNAAREAGYQLIVLQAEAGRRQAVTEILDTRPREESFHSLISVPITTPPDAIYNPASPAVYYPRSPESFLEA